MNTENDGTAEIGLKKDRSLLQKIKNAQLFIFAALFAAVVFFGGGYKLASEVYGNITGNLEDRYQPIPNPDSATLALFKSRLVKEGIQPADSELSVFSISEAVFKYRWQRGTDERVYVIRRNTQGVWDTYSQ